MSVFINSLDDFIAPSQACVNPLVQEKLNKQTKQSAKISVESDFSTSEYDVTVKPDLIKAKAHSSTRVATVSLNDCLACSGCVTSAEAVLIQEQSYHKLIDVLKEGSKCVVVTLSPQTVASIASFVNVPAQVVFLQLASFLKSLGVKYVVDASAGGDISLIEAREEFVVRYANGRSTEWVCPPTSVAHSSTHVILPDPHTPAPPPVPHEQSPAHAAAQLSPGNRPLPLLCSHCPGWVCFAEKTNPQCIPYMSTAKSAQQIIGAVLKLILPDDPDLSSLLPEAASIYHVSVQPCFDKKLEASRQDFFHEDISLDAMVEEEGDLSRGLREVDLVLSSTELWRMVEEHSAAVGDAKGLSEGDIGTADSLAAAHLNSVQPDSPLGRDAVEALLRCFSEDARRTVTAADSNAGSGGYLEHLFRYSARRLHGVEVPSEQALQYVQGRNADIAEVLLHVPGEHAERGEPLLRFAKVYGFRNIQSLLLKMKRGKAMYDFVEIMACPSGCVNGGGQLKTTAQEHPAQIAQRVANTSRYFHENMVVRDPIESPLAQLLYSSTGKISEGPFCDLSRKLLHTTYHAIPKLEVLAPLASKW